MSKTRPTISRMPNGSKDPRGEDKRRDNLDSDLQIMKGLLHA